MVRRCREDEVDIIYEIINDGAMAYYGVIPEDCWKEPYMSMEELRHEINDGVIFWGYDDGILKGVMGIQDVKDVTLIRHSYVKTEFRNKGIGGSLISHLKTLSKKKFLIGTWSDADWAISFYCKHGFKTVGREETNVLLNKYWSITDRQIATSVVLIEDN